MVFNNRISSHDSFYTPKWIVDVLVPFIPKNKIVWGPSCGEDHITDTLISHGIEAFGTDIITGHDFFTYKPDRHFDIIIENPAFSLKNEFLERCIEIGLPFALLMPLPALEGKIRGSLLSKINDLTLIIPDRRVAFIGADKSPNFSSAWFCSGFNLGKQLIFVDSSPYLPVKKKGKKQ